MKLFKITDKTWDYDCVEHVIVLAKDKESALLKSKEYVDTVSTIEEIDLSKRRCNTRRCSSGVEISLFLFLKNIKKVLLFTSFYIII